MLGGCECVWVRARAFVCVKKASISAPTTDARSMNIESGSHSQNMVFFLFRVVFFLPSCFRFFFHDTHVA